VRRQSVPPAAVLQRHARWPDGCESDSASEKSFVLTASFAQVDKQFHQAVEQLRRLSVILLEASAAGRSKTPTSWPQISRKDQDRRIQSTPARFAGATAPASSLAAVGETVRRSQEFVSTPTRARY